MSLEEHASVRRAINRGADQARPWVKPLARAGYVAKGILYLTIGGLAAMAAAGESGGRVTDSKGALESIHDQPFGQALLVLLAVGLAGYAIWQFVRAIVDPEGEARQEHGTLKRIGHFGQGALHAALVVYAIGLLTGNMTGGGAGDGKSWTAKLLAFDVIGPLLVAAVGIAVIAFAVREIVRAVRDRVLDDMDVGRLRPSARRWIDIFGRVGVSARAVVFGVVGAGLIAAALRSNAGEAKGVAEALTAIRSWDGGGLIFALVALGLVAYGLFELVEARYRRIPIG